MGNSKLRRGLRDPNTTNDVKVLLDRFRRRKDLLVTIADEIDNLIKNKRKAVSQVSKPNETNQLRKGKAPPDSAGDQNDILNPSQQPPELKVKGKERVKGVFILGLAALVIHTATWIYVTIVGLGEYNWIVNNYQFQLNFNSFYIIILSGAIAGVICGKNIRSICFSFIGLLVFPCWTVLLLMESNSQYLFFNDFGSNMVVSVSAGIMAIVGSILGKYLGKRKAIKTTTAKTTS